MTIQNVGIHWQSNSVFLCFIGGILLGIVCLSRMIAFGKVTGISGILGAALKLSIPFKLDGFKDISLDFERLTKIFYIGGGLV
jgi:hypothetical protein